MILAVIANPNDILMENELEWQCVYICTTGKPPSLA